MMANTDNHMMKGVQESAASGKKGSENRRKPYAPILMRMPARMMLPAVGAPTWASGSQVWNGNMGTLIAKASAKAANAKSWKVRSKPWTARAWRSKAPSQRSEERRVGEEWRSRGRPYHEKNKD